MCEPPPTPLQEYLRDELNANKNRPQWCKTRRFGSRLMPRHSTRNRNQRSTRSAEIMGGFVERVAARHPNVPLTLARPLVRNTSSPAVPLFAGRPSDGGELGSLAAAAPPPPQPFPDPPPALALRAALLAVPPRADNCRSIARPPAFPRERSFSTGRPRSLRCACGAPPRRPVFPGPDAAH